MVSVCRRHQLVRIRERQYRWRGSCWSDRHGIGRKFSRDSCAVVGAVARIKRAAVKALTAPAVEATERMAFWIVLSRSSCVNGEELQHDCI